MGMSGIYGPADEAESIATIHAAINAGVDVRRDREHHRALLRFLPVERTRQLPKAVRRRDRDAADPVSISAYIPLYSFFLVTFDMYYLIRYPNKCLNKVN
jgi:hypothetical protein